MYLCNKFQIVNFPPLSSVYSEAHRIFTSSSTTELKICTPGVVWYLCVLNTVLLVVCIQHVCVCVCERERERERKRERER